VMSSAVSFLLLPAIVVDSLALCCAHLKHD
jgi:hypothetical protein